MKFTKAILICSVVTVLSCTKDADDIEFPQETPMIFTEPVATPTADGAEFRGRIASVGKNQNIMGYGFAWSTEKSPTINDARVVIAGELQVGSYSQFIGHDLANGRIYYVRSFVQTDRIVIYGNEVHFGSLGSPVTEVVDFNPKQGGDGTEITLSVRNTGYDTKTKVVIGNLQLPIISMTDTEIKVKLLPNSLVGEYSLVLTTATQVVTTAAKFNVLAPVITSMSTSSARVADRIVVTGQNFDLAERIDFYIGSPNTYAQNFATATVVSPTQLEVLIPDYVTEAQPEIHSIKSGAEKIFVFDTDFKVIDSWKRIRSVGFNVPAGANTSVVGNLVYMIGGELFQTFLQTFNPATNEWLPKSEFAGTGVRSSGVMFEFNGYIYYGFGKSKNPATVYNDLWRYEVATNKWEFVMTAPIPERSNATVFKINNDVYIGFGIKENGTSPPTIYNDLWKFNPVNKSWTAVTIPITNDSPYGLASFVINGKAYVFGVGANQLWEFDAANSSWTKKKNAPNTRYLGEPMLSTGASGLLFANNLFNYTRTYLYSPATDSWKRLQTSPIAERINLASAFVNGKAYFGWGSSPDGSTQYTGDFYEFSLTE